jgi:hypothetical protein
MNLCDPHAQVVLLRSFINLQIWLGDCTTKYYGSVMHGLHGKLACLFNFLWTL